MIRVVKFAAIALASLAVIAIGAPLLFWLGRSQVTVTGPLTVDAELDSDDPGTDVDEGDDE